MLKFPENLVVDAETQTVYCFQGDVEGVVVKRGPSKTYTCPEKYKGWRVVVQEVNYSGLELVDRTVAGYMKCDDELKAFLSYWFNR